MAKQKQPEEELDAKQQEALEGLRGMGIRKTVALDYIKNVGGDSVEEILQNALKRHGTIRTGTPPITKPVPPNAIRVAPGGAGTAVRPASTPKVAPYAPGSLVDRFWRFVTAPPRPASSPYMAPRSPQAPPASPQTPPPSPQLAPIRPQMQPAPSAPTPAQQQTIPGFAPPGGPSAAPQPEQLQAQQSTQKPPFIQIVGAPPGWTPPKPVIRVRAAGQRIPSAPIAQPPTKEAQSPTKQAEPPSKAARPVSISTEKEYNDLPPGTDFIWGAHVWTKPK